MTAEIDYSKTRREASFDTECYPNYWSIEFRDLHSDATRLFELHEDSPLDRREIARVIRNFRIYGFNSNGYDIPMLTLAMSGASNALLKQASDEIILGDLRPWQFYDRFGLDQMPYLDHIDVQDVSPGAAQHPSLKLYGGRLHTKRMQDLPIEPDARITPNMRVVMRKYLSNDTQVTKELAQELKPQIDLRAAMSVQYGLDLRSKSDAQIAEAVIKSEVEKLTGRKVRKPEIKPGYFMYQAPKWIKFETPQLQEVFRTVMASRFLVKHDGQVVMPTALADTLIKIGGSAYQMGIGGLHSTEESRYYKSDDLAVLLDRDVTSYYPSLIINEGFVPTHMGVAFLTAYKAIFDRRVAAKAAGNSVVSESLKIVLNGSFGKFGSPYSVLYSPNLMIQTTITGQLAMLMLIEACELRGIPVVSCNTDGFVSRVPRGKLGVFESVIAEWEWDTGLNTEETEYSALYSRDVNNYLAFQPGKTQPKCKGAFAESGRGLKAAMGLKKTPAVDICTDAVVAYLGRGVPLAETIKKCDDLRKFLSVRRVNGGAEKDGEYIGKAIRWYYGYGEKGAIRVASGKSEGNTVPTTLGAVPCMELPDELPYDIDYEWYVREANALLDDLGVGSTVAWGATPGRKGIFTAHLPDQKTAHQVHAETGEARCGYRPKSMRMSWVESPAVGELRGCKACERGEKRK